MSKTCLFIGLSCLLSCVGCRGFKGMPKHPAFLKPTNVRSVFDDRNWRDNFDKAFKDCAASDEDCKKGLRNGYIDQFRLVIDQNYYEFTDKFVTNKNSVDFAGDVTQLLLAGAGTITNGARAKTILAAIASATGGITADFSKDYYAEQKQSVIVLRMDALREKVITDIETKKGRAKYDEYTLREAFLDLSRLFYAGRPIAALADIQNESGAMVKEEQGKRR